MTDKRLSPITDAEMLSEVRSALRMRRNVYRRRVENGEMTQARADRSIAVLEAVRDRLSAAKASVETRDPPAVGVLRIVSQQLEPHGVVLDIVGIRLADWAAITASIPDGGTDRERAHDVLDQLRKAYAAADEQARCKHRKKKLEKLKANIGGVGLDKRAQQVDSPPGSDGGVHDGEAGRNGAVAGQ